MLEIIRKFRYDSQEYSIADHGRSIGDNKGLHDIYLINNTTKRC